MSRYRQGKSVKVGLEKWPVPSNDSPQYTNVDAVLQIYLEHGAFIRGVVACQVQNEADVEELSQDIFVSLLSGPIPKDPNHARSFLYKAIINDIINFKKRKQLYRLKLRNRFGGVRREPVQTDPGKRCVEMEQLTRLYELINERVCQREAKAIKLRYRGGLSSGETAKVMGVSTRTVDNYVSVGLKKLREFMAREFGDE